VGSPALYAQVAERLRPNFADLDPAEALREARAIIETAITTQPRSRQRAIGPSELGNPCDHCLAAKLAHWPRAASADWLPYIGTAVHAALEDVFTLRAVADVAAGRPERYLPEARVMVGRLGGQEVWGTCDLFDVAAGMTVDWKVVGSATLRTAKVEPSPTYRKQAHLYAHGFAAEGYTVRHVAIAYLPRGAVSLDSAVWWTEPYSPSIATETLARAERMLTNLDALASVSEATRDEWIASLPRAEGCYDCARFADAPEPPKPARRGAFADLPGG